MKGKRDRQMFTRDGSVYCSRNNGLIRLKVRVPLSQAIAVQSVMPQGEE
jgi:hypothetical protein